MKNFIASLTIIAVLVVSANFCAAKSYFSYQKPFFYAQVVNCQVAVSLRENPDVYSECLIEIPLGTKVDVQSDSDINGFWLVNYKSNTGYVLKEYLRPIPWIECRDESNFNLRASVPAYIVNCREAVSLRYAPDVAADCLIEIPLGTKVDVCTIVYNGFVPVRYNGCTGYVLREYVQYRSEQNK